MGGGEEGGSGMIMSWEGGEEGGSRMILSWGGGEGGSGMILSWGGRRAEEVGHCKLPHIRV